MTQTSTIICPNCKKAFKVDEAGFADILKQVRDHEFEKALHERVEMMEKDTEIAELKASKNTEIAKLTAKIEATETEKKLAVTEAVNKIEKERDTLAGELKNKDAEKQLLV